MSNEEKVNLYKEAILSWGNLSRLDIVIEESAELIQAINKYKRDSSFINKVNLIEEMADVVITIENLLLLFDVKQSSFEETLNFKLSKFKLQIDNIKPKNDEQQAEII